MSIFSRLSRHCNVWSALSLLFCFCWCRCCLNSLIRSITAKRYSEKSLLAAPLAAFPRMRPRRHFMISALVGCHPSKRSCQHTQKKFKVMCILSQFFIWLMNYRIIRNNSIHFGIDCYLLCCPVGKINSPVKLLSKTLRWVIFRKLFQCWLHKHRGCEGVQNK